MRSAALLPAVALAFPTWAAQARHAERCEPIPKAQWKPPAELECKLANLGWKIRRVEIENGCYEVYGTDEKGAQVEVCFHPQTFERVVAEKKSPRPAWRRSTRR
jgi:hypothetical protein